MSLYQLQKLIYHVNRDGERREHYRRDAEAFTKNYDLTEPERLAILNIDVPSIAWASIRCCCGRLPYSTKCPMKIMAKR